MHLPEEIVLEVASYLEAREVLSLSLVCLAWRNCLNNNKLWKRLFFKNFLFWPKVEPTYPTLRLNGRLSDLCAWRKRFGEEASICNNWKMMKYESYDIPTGRIDKIEVVDHITFLCSASYFLVWDTRPQHQKILMRKNLGFRNSHPWLFKYNGTDLLVLQKCILQVYKVDKKDMLFKLRFRVAYDRTVVVPRRLDQDQMQAWYSNLVNAPLEHRAFDCSDEYFVGINIFTSGHCSVKMHIWNLRTYKKYHKIINPRTEIVNIKMVSVKVFGKRCFVMGKWVYRHIYCYDLEDTTEEKFQFKIAPETIYFISPKLFISITRNNITTRVSFWDNYYEEKFVGTVLYRCAVVLQYISEHLLVFTSKKFVSLVETENYTILRQCELNYDYNWRKVRVISPRLILFERRRNKPEIWDISKDVAVNSGMLGRALSNWPAAYVNFTNRIYVLPQNNQCTVYKFE